VDTTTLRHWHLCRSLDQIRRSRTDMAAESSLGFRGAEKASVSDSDVPPMRCGLGKQGDVERLEGIRG